jgi:hypothetical protein
MNGIQDDVKLPFSVLDPLVGDVFSVVWEPEMIRETGSALQPSTFADWFDGPPGDCHVCSHDCSSVAPSQREKPGVPDIFGLDDGCRHAFAHARHSGYYILFIHKMYCSDRL